MLRSTSPPTPPSRVLSPSSSIEESPTATLRALELEQGLTSGRGAPPRRERSGTISSITGFEFEHALLPLSLSGEEEVVQQDHKHVTLLHCMALVVGMQVGSGIFSSPGVVVASVGSVGASLLVWLLSGLLAWTGASSFAELGCAIPLSGGAQAYLAYAYGPMASYLYTWSAVSTLKPGSGAIIALIFGEYVNRMIYHAIAGEEGKVPEWTFKITATIAIVLVAALLSISPRFGANSAVVLTTIKIGSLIFVSVLGLLYAIKHGAGPSFSGGHLFRGSSNNPGAYAIALYSGLWAFDGWDQCSFIGGEMKNPNKDLPRALHSSMTIVVLLFLAANVSYFVVLDKETVALSNTVALDFGRVILGRLGAVVFSTVVAISCFGALNTSFYTTARLISAAARDHFLPEWFGRLHPTRRTPDHAMLLNVGLTTFFVIFGGGFRKLLNFFSVTSWTLYLVTVLGLIYLRIKEPHLERPYKTWITTPITFCCVALFLLLMPIFAAPWEALAAFCFMAAGIPVYYLTASLRAPSAGYARVDGGTSQGVLATAWSTLSSDVAWFLPRKWADALANRQTAPVASAIDREERRGMLSEQVEMTERH
ncbi:Cystine/glutamate transporter [Vanrija pseudolonga]|uniref:Cystine/glutamate transporter n=1 Tax=Vanrija pseudolonga TaxID=143232 RepID=A0AAF0YF35_9TREE|nr:Cystine/glutamate transporter [Vanrija pseudolonga]